MSRVRPVDLCQGLLIGLLAAGMTHAAAPMSAAKGKYFSGSGVCAPCHSNLMDEAGTDVSIDKAWRATMMGNSARDPFWRMVIRGEVLANPGLRAIIEDKCSTCHMPMARTTAAAEGGKGVVLDQGFGDPAHALHELALDSISCTLCHQINPDNLDTKESFTGHYQIDSVTTKVPPGEGAPQQRIYGPFVASPAAQVMTASSGYAPSRSLHIQDSALCGTCHNLFTPFVDANGKLGDYEVPEQVPYTEWKYSDYANRQTCQNCHMPPAAGKVALSPVGGDPHQGFSQHTFIGGNYYMLEILRKFGDEVKSAGTPEDFAANIRRTLDQLAASTAKINVKGVKEEPGKVSFDVYLFSETGHKLPTAYPARRMWLHTSVLDASGKVVFESGNVRDDGAIVGNAEDEKDKAFEPHYEVVTAPDQVQIYQAILANTDGEPTTTLLRSAKYLKDNRILPVGFDKEKAPPEIQVWGEAKKDANFVSGGDITRYEVATGDAKGPFTVETELLYQPINYRWVANLERLHREQPNKEAEDFLRYYKDTPNRPAVIATATTAPDGKLKNAVVAFSAPKTEPVAAAPKAAPAAAAAPAPAAAAAGTGFPIAGMTPWQRPAGAPVITEVVRTPAWYGQALTGISQPFPYSLRFLEDQGNWYTPFNRPGMPGRYDIRGWHQGR
jgi:hypothetical protein